MLKLCAAVTPLGMAGVLGDVPALKSYSNCATRFWVSSAYVDGWEGTPGMQGELLCCLEALPDCPVVKITHPQFDFGLCH